MSGNVATHYQNSAGLVKSPFGAYVYPLGKFVQFDANDKFQNMLLKIIAQDEFQRMRHIDQLGFVGWQFTDTHHTRFEHCITTADTAGQMFRAAGINKSIPASPDFEWTAHVDMHRMQFMPSMAKEFDMDRQAAIAAAILHDIGHTYPGHPFEGAIQAVPLEHYKDHEEWGREIIRHSEIYNILNSYSAGFAERVIGIMSGDNAANDIGPQVLDCNLNADTLDYMRRDQENTGFNAAFPQELMLELIYGIKFIKTPTGGVGIALIDGVPEMLFTQMLSARADLYQNVYFNPMHGGAEAFLPKLFTGIRDALDSEKYKSAVQNTNNPFVKFIESRGTDYEAYLRLDNYGFYQMAKDLGRLKIPGLSDIATRYKNPTAGFRGEEVYNSWSQTTPEKSEFSVERQALERNGGIFKEVVIPWYKPSKGEIYCFRGPDKLVKFSEAYPAIANNKSIIASKFFMNEM